MKKIVLLLALAAACVNAFAASPGDTVAAFHAALAAGDKAGALALLSPDIMIFESGYVERSRDEYASHHLASDIEFSKSTTRKVTGQREHVDGAHATVLQETTTSGAFKGKPVDLVGVETAMLEKNGDGWLIVHVHWSSRKAK